MIIDPWLAVALAVMFAGCGVVIGALITRVRLDLAFHRLEQPADPAFQVAPGAPPPSDTRADDGLGVYLRHRGAGDE